MNAEEKNSKNVTFFLKDEKHTVKMEDITPNMTLNTYIRSGLNLTGTKFMCKQGGCGSCIVVLQSKDPITKKDVYLAVNSCLISIMQCHGWRIYTIEGITPLFPALNAIQERLVQFNGTQCGFCSSGMLMNMYALQQSDKLTMQEIENSFGGNICRCTGYRPILTAFKSLAKDVDYSLIGTFSSDIEDVAPCIKTKCTISCSNICQIRNEPIYHVFDDGVKWIKVISFTDLLFNINKYGNQKYMLVGGNTAKGVYASYGIGVQVYIEITSVPELVANKITNDKLILGASTTLSDTMEIFKNVASENKKLSYLTKLANHIDLVANVPVRNIGTLAGNLMIKHDHNEFPSDIFLILETSGAELTIVNTLGIESKMKPSEFYKSDMKKKVLKEITFPPLSDDCVYESFKIMLRAQNVHAIVNAGFLFNFKKDQNTLDSAKVVYGNINPSFVHATKTENLLSNKKLFDNSTLQLVYAMLNNELKADLSPPDPGPEYRQQLAIALFYKVVLKIAPGDKISPQNKTGALLVGPERPLATGVQDYKTNKSMYPVSKPIAKLEAKAQCDGQAKYIMDYPKLPHQLYGAFVLAKARHGSKIINIDPTVALEQKDIVAFLTSKDIPGMNNYNAVNLSQGPEEIFCSGTILYFDQPIGLLLGNTEEALAAAVSLVKIDYNKGTKPPLITVRELLKANAKDKLKETITIVPRKEGTDVKHVLKSTYDIYQQYHFHMETQICLAVPTETGLDIIASTQWIDYNQEAIAQVLNIPNSKISVQVHRCGGAFGGKITRNAIVACAAALAAYKLRQPVNILLSLETNMRMIGKRWPFSGDYEVGVNDDGVIQYLHTDVYTDLGSVTNLPASDKIADSMMANYINDAFTINVTEANTEVSSNTPMRAPGTFESFSFMETILEHIAQKVGRDPLDVRIANMTKNCPLVNYCKDLKDWADLDKRYQDIKTFNETNRWQKKGLGVAIMAYDMKFENPYTALVAIFQGDGSVSVTHSGVEIGQGINTKVAQVCAYKLNIPLDTVTIVSSRSSVNPSSGFTASSYTSESVCYATLQACNKLLQRMQPYRDENPDASWKDLVQLCFQKKVQLSQIGFCQPQSPGLGEYHIYGAGASEVLVDVLTGQYVINRVDLIVDAGQSMSPMVDMGQVEGGFIMGMGYFTTEEMKYNPDTGEVLTDDTWTYYPPGAKDIPVDLRIKFPNEGNPVGVLNSKATGEPAVVLSIGVPLAVRNALASARTSSQPNADPWFPIYFNTSTERAFLNSLNDYKQYNL